MLPAEIIKKKRAKQGLSFEEIQFFINGYTQGEIPGYQMSALLMAIYFQGMNEQETIDLTQVMLDSGKRVRFNLPALPVDKHSTGGVGDKTSLIIAPLVAACGLPVPMMSGRGLGHTGGTVDKLESIPGFKTDIGLEDFKNLVQNYNLSMIGQTGEICPADKKVYALRDVTATVESLPLICASIMSKKIAEGIKGLVLDVKVGSGAFMKTEEDAQALARGLISIGKAHGVDCRALITNMNQPLGCFVGNALEVHECLAILKNTSCFGLEPSAFADTRELSIELSAQMLVIGQMTKTMDEARKLCEKTLESGQAFEKFNMMCKQQGGNLQALPLPGKAIPVLSEKKGYIQDFNTELVGVAGITLGAGRKLMSDRLDPICGIQVHKKIGEEVQKGETLFTIYPAKEERGVDEARAQLQQSITIDDSKVAPKSLILAEIS